MTADQSTDPYEICVRVDDGYAARTPSRRMFNAVALTLSRHDVAPLSGVTLLVTDDDAVQRLNARYRDVDAPTDVLSFPTEEDELPPSDVEEPPYLGDILIAFPYTARHAEQDGHDLADVLVLLAVHGTLHLLGYDHDNQANQAAMWAAQEAILTALDVPLSVIPPPYDYADDEEGPS